MNKIERAIKDTTTELKRLRNNKLCIDSKIEALEEQLQSLESIERDKSIPHVGALQEILNVVNLEPNGTGVIGVMNIKDFDKNITHTYVKYPDTQNTI
ncbi:MAG: hypothetical protein ACOVNU_04120 [Candidatus Kapaibacteriota bacterium]